MQLKTAVPALLALLLAACGAGDKAEPPVEAPPAPAAESAESPDETFDRALDDLTRAFFYHSPELTTRFGIPERVVPRTAHRLMDRSPAGEAARRDEIRGTLERVMAIDPTTLSGNRPRVHATVTTLIDGALAPSRVADFGTTIDGFGFWYLPYTINQLSGPTVAIPDFLNNQQPVRNAAEAEAYLVRLAAVDDALDGALENVRSAVSTGAIPPDFVVDKSLAVVESFAAAPAAENSLLVAFTRRMHDNDVAGADAFADRGSQ